MTDFVISEEQLNILHSMVHPEFEGIGADLLQKICSRPLSEHDPIRLNTQPEGCYCGDCQRYEQKECPYPGSNATMSLCNSFYMDVKKHDAEVAKKERGRVLDELLSYCRGAMESEGMLFEMQQVPIDDIEYAYEKLIKGESLRRSEP